MDEVTSLPEHAGSFLEEDSALFGLVFGVDLLIFSELVGTMGELAPFLVWTKAKLEVFFA